MKFKYETPQLYMRVCDRRDARLVYSFYMHNLKDFAKYEPLDLKAASTLVYYDKILEIESDMFLRSEFARYYLFEKTNPLQIVGTVAFRNINYAPHALSAQIGYKIDHRFRRRGYATEAIYTGCQAFFSEEHLHRIEATVLPDNVASAKLLENIGFVREGLLRKNIRISGRWQDHYLYALLNPYE